MQKHASGEVFRAARLQVFVIRRNCSVRSYVPTAHCCLSLRVRAYIRFCNRFVVEEKQRLLDMQTSMDLERKQLHNRLERSRAALVDSQRACEIANAECAAQVEEVLEARKALEANQARVAMVDKIMQDAENDRGILARRLLAAEAEVEAVKEEAKVPTRRMKGLETQLEHKETFLRDLARRYERACNALDVARKAQQDVQRKQQEERLASIVSRGLSGGTEDATSPRSSTMRQQLNAAMKRIDFLETRLSMFEGQSSELGRSGRPTGPGNKLAASQAAHVGVWSVPTIVLERSPKAQQGSQAVTSVNSNSDPALAPPLAGTQRALS